MLFDYRFDSRPVQGYAWAAGRALLRRKETLQSVELGGKLLRRWRVAATKLRDLEYEPFQEPRRFTVTLNCPPYGFGVVQKPKFYSCQRAEICPWCWGRLKVAKVAKALMSAELPPLGWVVYSGYRHRLPIHPSTRDALGDMFADFRSRIIDGIAPPGTAALWTLWPIGEGVDVRFNIVYPTHEFGEFEKRTDYLFDGFENVRVRIFKPKQRFLAAAWAARYPHSLLTADATDTVTALRLRPARMRSLILTGTLSKRFHRKPATQQESEADNAGSDFYVPDAAPST